MDPIIASISAGFFAVKLAAQAAIVAFLGATLAVQIAIIAAAAIVSIVLLTAACVGLYKLLHKKNEKGGSIKVEKTEAEPQVTTDETKEVILEDFECPVGLELMEDPVVAEDGYVYDRAALTEYAEQAVALQKKNALGKNLGDIEPTSVMSPKNADGALSIPLKLKPSVIRKQQIDAYRELMKLDPNKGQVDAFFALLNSKEFRALDFNGATGRLNAFLDSVFSSPPVENSKPGKDLPPPPPPFHSGHDQSDIDISAGAAPSDDTPPPPYPGGPTPTKASSGSSFHVEDDDEEEDSDAEYSSEGDNDDDPESPRSSFTKGKGK